VWQLLLMRFISCKLIGIIDILMWGVGFIPRNVFSWIEKDDDLAKTISISMNKVGYAKPLKLAWDAHNWNLESTQEQILGFSTTQIHYVFNEMGQSSLICNLYGFG